MNVKPVKNAQGEPALPDPDADGIPGLVMYDTFSFTVSNMH